MGSPFLAHAGGKLEFRKGQDIVIAAFKTLLQRHQDKGRDLVLVIAWANAWSSSVETMRHSPHVHGLPSTASVRDHHHDGDDVSPLMAWLRSNGIPLANIRDLGRYVGMHIQIPSY